MKVKENILVSACLLGAHCRYDGGCQQIEEFKQILPVLMDKYNLIPICPEIYGGLATPREPSEIRDGKVYTCSGKDVTDEYTRGAEETLNMAQLYACRSAVMKLRSPSCGNGHIYDGTFSKKIIPGDGIAAALLKKNGIRVVGELQTEELLQ